MTDKIDVAIRRILVAIDGSNHSLAALDAAAELAARLHADLAGLFVEDIDLLRWAGLPFARELRYPTVSDHPVDECAMERQLRALASQARRALEEAAARRQVQCTFRVVRGRVAPKVLEAAKEADLLTLGFASRPVSGRVKLGSTAREAAEKAPRSVLLLQTGSTLHHPVVAIFDGYEPSRRALKVATSLTPAQGVSLTVLLLCESPARAQTLQQEAQDLLRLLERTARFHLVGGYTAQHLLAALTSRRGGMLIIPNSPLLPPHEVQRLVDELHCPVLLVR
ncbi:MAG: universal stress protein [Bradymonadales bacterium]|nr:universal stress protein [Bradymonadales bacterium]